MRNLALFLLNVMHPGFEQAKKFAPTPKSCESCFYRRPEWRDGGWCYMFKEAVLPMCGQYKRDATAREPAESDHDAKL